MNFGLQFSFPVRKEVNLNVGVRSGREILGGQIFGAKNVHIKRGFLLAVPEAEEEFPARDVLGLKTIHRCLFVEFWLEEAQVWLLLVFDALDRELNLREVESVGQHSLEILMALRDSWKRPLPGANVEDAFLGSRGVNFVGFGSVRSDVGIAPADRNSNRCYSPWVSCEAGGGIGSWEEGHASLLAMDVPGGYQDHPQTHGHAPCDASDEYSIGTYR